MKAATFTLAVSMFLLAACEKEKINIPEKNPREDKASFILAGQTDSLTHLTFPEDTIFNGQQADINHDGVYEFVFNTYTTEFTQQDCDEWMANNCPTSELCDCFPWIETDASIKYHLLLNVIRHPEDYNRFPLPLELNDTISNDQRWAEADSGLIYDAYNGTVSDYYWPRNEYKYLGFRWVQAQDTLFGWVKMKLDKWNLVITEVAYQE